ncbi:WxL domain-containing protein [Enterococcus sp. BWR-S5]|uniref:WxL domain-containing protein n=1 Tax=Enterococcus sp. BWR-S5 TaxID=2787714 RepID=UPI0019240A99|nr:WxL domain-containing protein [Enterococcus sp. BWR-S5]MBL1225821.1 WxL domain-containing protein [Enterococcus sp. BWR-S5]
MKTWTLLSSIACGCILFGAVYAAVEAEATSGSATGTIEFEVEDKQQVYDPENPGTVVDPGDSPKTEGPLRIDFVPQFRFGTNKAVNEDTVYSAYAQLFKDDTSARGNFVQVSDYRAEESGWELSIKQEAQFENENGRTLDGAIISLDHSWTSSMSDSATAPTVKKDVITMSVGESQILATAATGTGGGTWAINFGASAANSAGQQDTLTPLLDANGNPVPDSTFGDKPIYLNSAIGLNIPGRAEKQPGTTYKTVITWTLSELP